MNNYRIHPNFPSYRIYNDGRIQNIQPYKYNPRTEKYIHNGYYLKFKKHRVHPKWKHRFCSLVKADGTPNATVYIHKIVAELFVPNPQHKKHVIHIDKNKKNNFYTNLRWVSQGDINHIQYANGTRDKVKEASVMRKNGGIKDWTPAEIKRLFYLRDKKKLDWKKIGRKFPNRSLSTCQVKYSTYRSKKKNDRSK